MRRFVRASAASGLAQQPDILNVLGMSQKYQEYTRTVSKRAAA
jgi:hypothetical protein